MSNIASVLKAEIARVARKETRSQTQALRKAVTQYRSQIAQLKRQMHALEQQLNQVARANRRARSAAQEEQAEGPQLRFSAKGLAAQRQRLGLSAASVAKILGVSALSIYKWESGKVRPRAKQVEAIAKLRTMGKREAAQRLAE